MVDYMVHKCGLYFIWDTSVSLHFSASSYILLSFPCYTATLTPLPLPLPLPPHRQVVAPVHCLSEQAPPQIVVTLLHSKSINVFYNTHTHDLHL